jgi:transcriptional regulator with XRE-family HTH domain
MVCEVPPCSEWDEQREPGALTPTFGPIVRTLREARGLSLRTLARRIGLHASYLSRIETGQKPPPAAETIEKLAAALDVPAEALLAVTGKVPARMRTMLGTSTAALHFVQQAHAMGLTEAEWQALVQHLQRLRCP